jgi:hypothetical protein
MFRPENQANHIGRPAPATHLPPTKKAANNSNSIYTTLFPNANSVDQAFNELGVKIAEEYGANNDTVELLNVLSDIMLGTHNADDLKQSGKIDITDVVKLTNLFQEDGQMNLAEATLLTKVSEYLVDGQPAPASTPDNSNSIYTGLYSDTTTVDQAFNKLGVEITEEYCNTDAAELLSVLSDIMLGTHNADDLKKSGKIDITDIVKLTQILQKDGQQMNLAGATLLAKLSEYV